MGCPPKTVIPRVSRSRLEGAIWYDRAMAASTKRPRSAWLILETGEVFQGTAFGASGESFGEVVFNTGTTGYVEVVTDPSYTGQIVVMTQPHIGNYGVQPEDFESSRPSISGFCVQDLSPRPRHPRSRMPLEHFLERHGVPGVTGIPTREITLKLRDKGSLRGLLTTRKSALSSWLARIRRSPQMKGRALVSQVTTPKPYVFRSERWEGGHRIAVLDFGVKRSMLEVLSQAGCYSKVFPASTSADAILEAEPDAILLANGPGDPAALPETIAQIKRLLANYSRPVLGICLGHQLLALAAGARSYKLAFGHHGINHPVKDERTGKILITTQNHGFAIKPETLPKEWKRTHLSLNDGTLEGFRHGKRPVFAYQFHPEAGPGPLEARELLREFIAEI